MAPGPAFATTYDNKYKDDSAFANDKGRVKEPLNINRTKAEFLMNAERAEFLKELKETTIKFLHPEMGSWHNTFIKGKNI